MTKNPIKQHFVFDLDETLVDSREFCGETIARVIKHYHPDNASNQVKMLHDMYGGAAIVDHYKRMIQKFGLTTGIETLLELDAKIQKEEVERMQLFDGVVEILQFLRKRNKCLHILTNRKKDTLIPILKSTRISKYFDNITSCVDEGYKKPDSKCLNDLIKSSGCEKDEFIYFGDTAIDKEFANNANIDFVIFDQYLNDKNIFKKLINLFIQEDSDTHKTPPLKRFTILKRSIIFNIKSTFNRLIKIPRMKACQLLFGH